MAEEEPALVEVLAKSQAPVVVAAVLLRQWWQKYHHDSGPLHIDLGADIRREYPYFNYWALHGVLMRLRQPVLLDRRVVRTWLDKYAPRRISANSALSIASLIFGKGKPEVSC